MHRIRTHICWICKFHLKVKSVFLFNIFSVTQPRLLLYSCPFLNLKVASRVQEWLSFLGSQLPVVYTVSPDVLLPVPDLHEVQALCKTFVLHSLYFLVHDPALRLGRQRNHFHEALASSCLFPYTSHYSGPRSGPSSHCCSQVVSHLLSEAHPIWLGHWKPGLPKWL